MASDETLDFTFDERALRYRHKPSGRFVSEFDVNEALQQVIDAQILAMQLLGDRLRVGAIGLQDWQIGMAESVRTLHVVSAGLAVGGFARLDAETIRTVEGLVARQLDFLAAFSIQIQIGDQPLNGVFARRIAMYAEAGLGAAQEIRRGLAIRLGYDEERRLLGQADHCRTCVRQAKLGWRAIGTLKRIGDSECRTSCRCRFEFRYR
jgi:hypothetical protein